MKTKVFYLYFLILVVFFLFQCGSKKTAEIKLEPEVPSKYVYRFPSEYDPNEPPPLVIALHGHNQAENQATKLWDEGFFYEPDFILVSVRGPFQGKDGYEWFSQNKTLISNPVQRGIASAPTCEEIVIKALAEFKEEKNIEPDLIYLLGFSQGATMALYIGLKNPDIFDGIAAISGNMDTFLLSASKIKDIEDMDIFLALGRGEGPRAVEAIKVTKSLLEQSGANVRLYLHDEGHVINASSCRAMQNFLSLSFEEAPETELIDKPESEEYDMEEEESFEYWEEEEDESDYQEE